MPLILNVEAAYKAARADKAFAAELAITKNIILVGQVLYILPNG